MATIVTNGLNMNTASITSLADPTNQTDAATKQSSAVMAYALATILGS